MGGGLCRRFARDLALIGRRSARKVMNACCEQAAAGDSDAVRRLALTVMDDPSPAITAIAARGLTHLPAGEAMERFCDLVLSTGDERLCTIAVSCGYEPADEPRRALFLLVTGQQHAPGIPDWDLIAHGYCNISFAKRVAALQAACRLGYAAPLRNALFASGTTECLSFTEWEMLTAGLPGSGSAGDLWRALFSVPPPLAAGIWSSIRASGFSPFPGYLTRTSRLRSCQAGELHYPEPPGLQVSSLQSPGSAVIRVSLSPDGSVLATGCLDGTVGFWSLPDGELLVHAPAHDGNATVLSWSPDGVYLATAGRDSVLVWEARDHRIISSFPVRAGSIRALAWCGPELLVVGGSTGSLSLWRPGSCELPDTRAHHRQEVLSLVPLASHGLLLSGDRAGRLSLFRADDGPPSASVQAHRRPVREIHAEWPFCVTVTDQGAAACWTLPDLGLVCRHPGHRSRMTAFAASGQFYATGDAAGEILIQCAGTGNDPLRLLVHKGGVLSLAFRPGGSVLAAGSGDGTIRCWEAGTGRQLWEKKAHKAAVRHLESSPSGEALVSSADDGTIRLWRLQDGSPVATLGRPKRAAVTALAVADDGYRVVAGDGNGCLMEGDSAAGNVLDFRYAYTSQVRSLAALYPHRLLAVGGPDGLWLRDTDRRAPLKRLEGHEGTVQALAVSPDGSYLASGGWDQTIRLWSVPGGEPAGILAGHESAVQALAFTSANTLVSAANDRTVRVWDVPGRRLRYTLTGHRHVVSSLAAVPGSGVVASGSWDGTIRLWDPVQGIGLGCIEASEGRVLALAADPAGTLLASGSSDGKVRLWTAPDCRPVRTRSGSPGAIAALAFAADGKLLLTGDEDGGVRAWKLPWTRPAASATPADLAAVSAELAAGSRMPARERREWEFLAALIEGACFFDIEYAGTFACPGPFDIELAEWSGSTHGTAGVDG